MEAGVQGNGQEAMPELNEADMLGSDLLDALEEDEMPAINEKAHLQLNQQAAPFVPCQNFNQFTQKMNNFEVDYPQYQQAPMFTPMDATKTWKPQQQPMRMGQDFKFPDGGWECSKCQNYNFKGRKNCHRCKKARADDDVEGKPEHMNMPACEKAAMKLANKAQKRLTRLRKTVQEMPNDVKEKGGDWVCQQCFNHNYSFRSHCNKC